MMRAKLLDFYKFFEVICSASGSTKAQAEHFHSIDVDYKKRWIRGELIEATKLQSIANLDGTYTVYNTLKFINRKFLEKNDEKD